MTKKKLKAHIRALEDRRDWEGGYGRVIAKITLQFPICHTIQNLMDYTKALEKVLPTYGTHSIDLVRRQMQY